MAKGHVLLLPKEHVQVMPQMNPELTGALAIATQKISKKLTCRIWASRSFTESIPNEYIHHTSLQSSQVKHV